MTPQERLEKLRRLEQLKKQEKEFFAGGKAGRISSAGKRFPISPETMLEEIKKPEVIGGQAGELIGTPFGLPGRIIGAGIGGGLGRAMEVQREIGPSQMILGREGLRIVNVPTKKQLEDIAVATSEQAAYAVGGEFISRGLQIPIKLAGKTIRKWLIGPITRESRIAINELKKHMPNVRSAMPSMRWIKRKLGIVTPYYPLMPAEATENWLLDYIHNMVQASFLGGKRVVDYLGGPRKRAVQRLLTSFTNNLGKRLNPAEAGQMVLDIANNKVNMRKILLSPFYDQVDDRMAAIIRPISRKVETPILDETGKPIFKTVIDNTNDIVDMRTIKKFFKPIADRARKEGAVGGDYGSIADSMTKSGDWEDWLFAKSLREDLLNLQRNIKFAVGENDRRIGLINTAVAMIDEVQEKAIRNFSTDDTLRTWRTVNELYKGQSNLLNTDFVKKIFKNMRPGKRPESLLLAFRKNNETEVKNLLRLVSPKGDITEPLLSLQQLHFEYKILRPSLDIKTGQINWERFYNRAFGTQGLEPEQLRLLYKGNYAQLKKIATTLKVAYQKQAGGVGSMLIQLKQAAQLGAIPGVLGFGLGYAYTGEAGQAAKMGVGVFIVSPYVLARMFTSPTTAKLLIEGLEARGGKQIASAVLRLNNAANQIREQIIKEEIERNKKLRTSETLLEIENPILRQLEPMEQFIQ